jgi:DNA-directed RNA polymerase subunit RPC12/RpoP
MEIFFFWLIMAVVVSFVANAKGRSAGLWFLYGLVIWPIALIHAIVMSKTVEALEQEKLGQGNIRCPNCADWVYKEAKTCPHCQHRLTAKSRVQPVSLSKAVRENLTIEEDTWQAARNLNAATYKIYLSEKFNIKKNELFEQYVCGDEMFDSLDDALAHADQLDREQNSDSSRTQNLGSGNKMSLPPHLQNK